MTAREIHNEDEIDQRGKGKDMDAESTKQNFIHVAMQGDISPRIMEKVKSAGRGRRKQAKEPNTQAPGVQTRRTISKSTI